jgi:urease accessory protein
MKLRPDTPPENLLVSGIALLQLSSVALPVGAYSYSQGLETAIDDGRLASIAAIETWIHDVLRWVIGRYEAPLWWQLYRACDEDDARAFTELNEEFLATRETAELRAETVQMGHSMVELLAGLGLAPPAPRTPLTWPAAHAWAARAWHVAPSPALAGYLYGWAENQVMAAIKSFALGQRAGQQILLGLRGAIAEVSEAAAAFPDTELSTHAPAFAITSARHEEQYSRLFRS